MLLKTTAALLAAAVSVVLVAAADGDQLRKVRIDQRIPAFSLPLLDGGTIRNDGLDGDALVVVYLAAGQRSSEAAAQDAMAVHQSLDRDDVTLLFVTADVEETEYFRRLRGDANLHAPLGLDRDRRLYGDLGIIVLPTTILVNAEGRLAHVISSHKSDYPHVLHARLEHTLGILDDAALAERLESRQFQRDRPIDRINRHRAAAQVLRRNGLLGEAENELNLALEIDAAHVETRLDLAALCVAGERIDEAEAIVGAILEEAPDHRRAKLLRGVVLYHHGSLDEAEKALKEVLLLNPDPVYTRYYLGLIAEAKGNTAAAAKHYREALSRMLEDRPL
jgi:tetratricopeptide (TPR) repeat protein